MRGHFDRNETRIPHKFVVELGVLYTFELRAEYFEQLPERKVKAFTKNFQNDDTHCLRSNLTRVTIPLQSLSSRDYKLLNMLGAQ